VQALEHRLEHARPFGAVAGQLRGLLEYLLAGQHAAVDGASGASESCSALGKVGLLASCTYDGVCCFTPPKSCETTGFGLGLI
jgi:hypothetical protein